jgi:hypothetical protein
MNGKGKAKDGEDETQQRRYKKKLLGEIKVF